VVGDDVVLGVEHWDVEVFFFFVFEFLVEVVEDVFGAGDFF